MPFNYKKKAYKEVLPEHGPLDVYYVRLIRPKQFLDIVTEHILIFVTGHILNVVTGYF